jgi:hypothetical protein
MKRPWWVHVLETALLTTIAWWTWAIERGEKPNAMIWLFLLKRLRTLTALFGRAVIAAEIHYYEAVSA